ncbi:DUF4133 domain-containing protein [Hymenobacter tenuis]
MSQYPLNKGINKPVEFKGLLGQYIFYLLGGLGGVFLFFIGIYVAGVNTYLAVALALGLGFAWTTRVFQLNARYGEHGAMKLRARQRQPRLIVNRNARLFKDLKHL